MPICVAGGWWEVYLEEVGFSFLLSGVGVVALIAVSSVKKGMLSILKRTLQPALMTKLLSPIVADG